MAEQLLDARKGALRLLAALTPRERDVVALIADGMTNKEAGRVLGISPRTVEIHRLNIFGKMGVRSAAECAKVVFQATLGGLVKTPPRN